MDYASIEREILIEAAPEIVFEVLSQPEHLREWWPDEVHLEPGVGGTGELSFRHADGTEPTVAPITVVEFDPPRRFGFRWAYDSASQPLASNSFLVVFDLIPSGDATTVRMTETGFREQGWDLAVLEAAYRDHESGWDYFVPRLGRYARSLAATS